MSIAGLTKEEVQVLDREVTRLRAFHGIKADRVMIIKALIRLHKARLQAAAAEQDLSTILGVLWGRTWIDDADQ